VRGTERALNHCVKRAPTVAAVSAPKGKPPAPYRDRMATIPSDMTRHARQSREQWDEQSSSGIRARNVRGATSPAEQKNDLASPYWAVIGGADRVVILALPCGALHIPRRGVSGFILCRLTGASTVREILEGCSLPVHVALAVLCELAAEGIVSFQ
jgi:hypothetical protein